MRAVHKRSIPAAGIIAAGAYGLLTTALPSWVSAPRAGVVTGDATVSPFAMNDQWSGKILRMQVLSG